MEFLIVLSITGLALTAFLPASGFADRLRRKKNDQEKILIEDTLKHLYDCEYKSVPCTLNSVMKTLSISKEKSEHILNKLESLDFVLSMKDEYHLTQKGRINALSVIRIHRLWEKYFADNTSLSSIQWHTKADELEHAITQTEADKLAAGLGNPLFDPHGDPIPTSAGVIPEISGISINHMRNGEIGIINHIEDEPADLFSIIAALNLFPGQRIRILSKSEDKILFTADGNECELPLEVASNISVIETLEEQNFDKYETLASLNSGEEGEVLSIAGSCRGMQRRRLMDLGVVPGTRIKAELKSIGSNPIAFNIRGALIALRKEHAQQIYIRKISEN